MVVKITKLGHSCVYYQSDDRSILIDPGAWSDSFDIDKIPHVDRLVLTHEHGDHMDVDKIKAVVGKFPELIIVSNSAVKNKLTEAGVDAVYQEDTMCCKSFTSPHENLPVPGVSPPDCTGYNIQDVFSHPGDSHSFSESKAILALPIVAPWGSPVDAVDVLLKVKPQHVFLIHDWHLSRDGFDWYQNILEKVCSENNINFVRVESSVPFTIEV